VHQLKQLLRQVRVVPRTVSQQIDQIYHLLQQIVIGAAVELDDRANEVQEDSDQFV
jgi:hypothetical protein